MMGGLFSSSDPPPQPPPPSPPLLSEPWRTIHWGDNQSALQHVKDYKPPTEGQHIRILLYGPSGAGKSSFINSVQSVLQGKMCSQALVDNVSLSFTRQYTTYKIPKEDGQSFYPFVFNDIRGLEIRDGVLVDDIKLVLRGHMRDGYKFNPASTLSEDDLFYNKNPSTNDRVHILVLVTNTEFVMDAETVQKIQEIRMEASDLDIPQVAIVTKIDEICPEITDNLQNVYKVKYMKEKMEQFSAEVGIPMTSIFPVKNYHEEIDINSDIDSLILSALKHIITTGGDHVNFKKTQSECSGTWA
uniref:Interferon-induced protein 44-like n=1 Tax=Sparus aurata TaxID=8175 RepID=A0A671TX87_SPAAU